MLRKRRFTEEQIIAALKQVEGGMGLRELCRQLGVTTKTFNSWRAKYGGMAVSDAKRLRQLENESRRLKQIVAELKLGKQALQWALGKKSDDLTSTARGRRRPPGAVRHE